MKFMNNMRAVCNKALFSLKKNSPKILTGGAIVFGVGAVVATWFAARKTDKVLEEPKKIIAEAKAKEITEDYTEKDQSREIRHGYFKGAGEIIKLYGPAALMGTFSIACVLGSYKILSARNAGLVMANGILQKEFSDYRDKVVEKYGKEEDHHFRYDDKMEEVEKTITDENGEEKTVVEKQPKKDYAKGDLDRYFGKGFCNIYKNDAFYNVQTLHNIREDLNRRLRLNGVLTLAEAYRAFDWEPTQASFQYGWVVNKGTQPTTWVDFGIPWLDDPAWENMLIMESRNEDFSLDYNRQDRNIACWIHFNCEKFVYSDFPFEEV